MALFGGSSKKSEAMLEKANRLKERAIEAGSAGKLLDFPVALNGDGSVWEVQYILHVSEKVFSQLTTSPEIVIGATAAEMNVQGIPLLCIFVRLNNNKEYSYAMIARVDIFGGKGTELQSLNYADLLLEQKTFSLKIYCNGQSISATITNPLHNSMEMMKIKDHLDRFLAGKDSRGEYSVASSNLRFNALLSSYGVAGSASETEDEKFGHLLWGKYGDANKSL